MCFFKKQKEQINSLQKQLDELTKIIKNQQFIQYEKDSKELKLTKELLSKIKLTVKNIKVIESDTGFTTVRINYDLPYVQLELDEYGESEKNDLFYAINMLDLTPIGDLEKIRTVLENQRKIKKD